VPAAFQHPPYVLDDRPRQPGQAEPAYHLVRSDRGTTRRPASTDHHHRFGLAVEVAHHVIEAVVARSYTHHMDIQADLPRQPDVTGDVFVDLVALEPASSRRQNLGSQFVDGSVETTIWVHPDALPRLVGDQHGSHLAQDHPLHGHNGRQRARDAEVQQTAQLEPYFPDVLALGQRIQVRDQWLIAYDLRR
jgi:hypothetical protein